MNRYETLFILHPELSEGQRKETVERMQRLVEGMDAGDVVVDEWGLRDLAYLIEKQSRGVYVRLEYSGRPEVVKELERTMRLADEVLRFVSVRLQGAQQEAAGAAAASAPAAAEAPAPGAE